jgi:hypothetical protein
MAVTAPRQAEIFGIFQAFMVRPAHSRCTVRPSAGIRVFKKRACKMLAEGEVAEGTHATVCNAVNVGSIPTFASIKPAR